jgi:hypothetical protein
MGGIAFHPVNAVPEISSAAALGHLGGREYSMPARSEMRGRMDDPLPVADILNDVKEQAMAAFASPFFDASESESEPTIKVGVTEAGTVHITAHRNDPAYRAELTLYVRSDLESELAARYEIRGRCEIIRDAANALTLQREFALRITIADDGSPRIDVDQLRTETAEAIRAFGTSAPDQS